MDRPRQCTIEAHPRAATLYLAGAVSVRALVDAMRLAERLPAGVWLLRVDATGAEPLDEGTATVLAHLLRRWSERRTGITMMIPRGASAHHAARAPGGRTRLRCAWRRGAPAAGSLSDAPPPGARPAGAVTGP
ncbi:MAG TPA: hypothetical protein VF041_19235 [Gemmatimonadaceae bacterium]